MYIYDPVKGHFVWGAHFAKSTTWECLNVIELTNMMIGRPKEESEGGFQYDLCVETAKILM